MPIKTRLNDSPSPTLRWVKGVCLISCNPTSVFWGRMAGIFSSTTAIARRGNVPAQNVDLGEENSLSAPFGHESGGLPLGYIHIPCTEP